jgi:hypothetical protein
MLHLEHICRCFDPLSVISVDHLVESDVVPGRQHDQILREPTRRGGGYQIKYERVCVQEKVPEIDAIVIGVITSLDNA